MVGKSLNIKLYKVKKEDIHKVIFITLADNIYYPIKTAFPKSGIDGLLGCDKLTFCYDEETIICESKNGTVKILGSDVYYLLYDSIVDNMLSCGKISYYKTRELLEDYYKLYYKGRARAAKKRKVFIVSIPESGRAVKKEVTNVRFDGKGICGSIPKEIGAETELILLIDSMSVIVSELRNGWSYSLQLSEQEYKRVKEGLLRKQ